MEQNQKLAAELSSARKLVHDLQQESEKLEAEMRTYRGDSDIINSMSLEQCNETERSLKETLDRVEKRKEFIIRNELGQQKEQRLCIICQEKEKSVVLLPCRHLCLCDDCASHEDLQQCPLCRKPIAHRISVFS